jgi:dihydroorotate dehydrogenase
MIQPISALTSFAYKNFAKPVLFQIDPKTMHEHALIMSRWSGTQGWLKSLTHASFAYGHPALEHKILGTTIAAPIGLAAGYDYELALPQFAGSLGLGWQTVGSITLGAYAGNQPPMYGRLPQSKSLWVNKGFKNPGVKEAKRRLLEQEFSVPVGMSIGATNRAYTSTEELIEEYVQAFKVAKTIKSLTYFELNVSCPNLHTKIDWSEPKKLERLLKAVDGCNLSKPVLIKMPIDITGAVLVEMLKVIRKHNIQGIILGNLTKKRENPAIWRSELSAIPPQGGGFSGLPTQKHGEALIRLAYREAGKELLIVGCGGIFNGQDAYRKLRSGSSLLQMITGLIFEGPQVVGQIHAELVEQLHRDGFEHISEVVGLDAMA